jgi:Uma2 family endonuclease
LEEVSETKHEFVDGHAYDWPGYEYDAQGLAGATRLHNLPQVNVLAALTPAARLAGRQVFGSDMRLRVNFDAPARTRSRRYYYPDAMVVCDAEVNHGDDEMHVTRPCVIVEIISRRSVRIDHTEKLHVYQAIPSVQAYLIVHQNRRQVERYLRDDLADRWHSEVITSGSVPIPCIGQDLALDAIYPPVDRAMAPEF